MQDVSHAENAGATTPITGRGPDRGRVAIIGGGVGGLAAAIRLAAAGCGVTVLEKNERVGGKLNRCELPHPGRPGERPFRFDTGPSLLTLPFVFDDLFQAGGTTTADELDLVRLDPISRFIWRDGTTFELRADEAETLSQVAAISPSDVEGWRRFYENGRRVWGLAGELFLMNSPEVLMRRGDLSPRDGLKMLSVPFRIGMFGRYGRLVDRHVKHPRLREILNQYATYGGASPTRAPATLGVIPYAEAGFGGWYPRGGMYSIAEALRRVGERLGVVYRTNAAVKRLLIDPPHNGDKRGTVRGVELADGETVMADATIANSDVVYTYRDLIHADHRRRFPDKKLDRLDPGGSGMVLLLGVEGTYPQLAHHTKFMPSDYRGDLRAMFETGTIPDEPCVYVCATTRTDATQAPDGCENLFVLVSAPPLHGNGKSLDWPTGGRAYRDRVVSMLQDDFGLSDLKERIVAEDRWTPRELQSTYNANAGSIYGLGSNSRRSAFLRPPNRDKDVRGLYFAGGATHPGGGLPLVALSGKIAGEMVLDDLRVSTA